LQLVKNAHVAELVDAADSKSAIRKGVKVRFLSWAQAEELGSSAFFITSKLRFTILIIRKVRYF
jgi:hypothetical protein